jgi:DNA-binding ferritin-like protein (Dps family)
MIKEYYNLHLKDITSKETNNFKLSIYLNEYKKTVELDIYKATTKQEGLFLSSVVELFSSSAIVYKTTLKDYKSKTKKLGDYLFNVYNSCFNNKKVILELIESNNLNGLQDLINSFNN